MVNFIGFLLVWIGFSFGGERARFSRGNYVCWFRGCAKNIMVIVFQECL